MLRFQVSSQRLGLPLKPIDLLPNLKIALIGNFRCLRTISRFAVVQMGRKGLYFQNVGIYTGCPLCIEN